MNMSPKLKKKKSEENQNLEVDQKAVKILRNLKNEEAFHFYENIGKPTGERAESLSDFAKKVNTVKLESLRFHLERKDFQRWMEETLGDAKLAEMIGKIAPTNDERLRAKIKEVIGNRLQELKDAYVTIDVRDELTITR